MVVESLSTTDIKGGLYKLRTGKYNWFVMIFMSPFVFLQTNLVGKTSSYNYKISYCTESTLVRTEKLWNLPNIRLIRNDVNVDSSKES